MTNSQHTPGPWVISARNNPAGADISGRQGHHFICDILYSEGNHPIDIEYNDQQTANARLIAAAPDLLEALRFILAYPENDLHEYSVKIARAAIAKARGEA